VMFTLTFVFTNTLYPVPLCSIMFYSVFYSVFTLTFVFANTPDPRYTVKLNFSVGPSSTVAYETQTVMEEVPGKRMVVECVTKTPDVPYGKNYYVRSMFLLGSDGKGRTRLIVKGNTVVTGACVTPPPPPFIYLRQSILFCSFDKWV
jgi:hypothetical protein